MREILWERKALQNEMAPLLQAEYYLLVEEVKMSDSFSCEHYGIKLSVQKDGGPKETISIPRISPNTKRMVALIQQLSENLVTPASLPDILDDWLTMSETSLPQVT